MQGATSEMSHNSTIIFVVRPHGVVAMWMLYPAGQDLQLPSCDLSEVIVRSAILFPSAKIQRSIQNTKQNDEENTIRALYYSETITLL